MPLVSSNALGSGGAADPTLQLLTSASAATPPHSTTALIETVLGSFSSPVRVIEPVLNSEGDCLYVKIAYLLYPQ